MPNITSHRHEPFEPRQVVAERRCFSHVGLYAEGPQRPAGTTRGRARPDRKNRFNEAIGGFSAVPGGDGAVCVAPADMPSSVARLARRIAIGVTVLVAIVLAVGAALAGFVAYSAHTGVARADGTVAGLAVGSPVRIVRDDRGIPHIRAQNARDLYFAQGYVTGSERLFQIDLTRRYVLGRLSEMLGAPLLPVDQRHRILDVRAVVEREYAALPSDQREALEAFAGGINAAARREPLPPEYRTLAFSFEPWRPQDAIAVGFATVLDLADGWDEVLARDRVVSALGPRAIDAFYSLTDPYYDTPTVGGAHVRVAPLPALDGPHAIDRTAALNVPDKRDVLGSNEWVAGAARTRTGRALLADDPHLDSSIPGIWHLADLAAPGIHVAGATLAGVPGIVLGHNAHIAWGSTNGTVAAPRLYTERFTTETGTTYRSDGASREATVRSERFAVRFGETAERRYQSTRHGFVIEERGLVRHAVQWYAAESRISPLSAFYALDRAPSVEAARTVLAAYPGPVQNFVVADDRGRALYTLAGFIPNDPLWGLRAHDGATAAPQPLIGIPFALLPHLDASRDLVANNSNNLQYGAGYPYRLSPGYSPPYRAAEIAHDLQTRSRYTTDDFRTIAADTTSFAERDLARMCAAALHATGDDNNPAYRLAYEALASFDGHMNPDSRGATVAQRLRLFAARDLIESLMTPDIARAYFNGGPAFVTLMRALRERPHGWFAHDDRDAFLRDEFRAALSFYGSAEAFAAPYGEAYAVVTKHPLSAFGLQWWNGPRKPGGGGSFAPAVQTQTFGQSFRAVWDVGNWDAGGIDIPLGESGEPGSSHYTDLNQRYIRHELTPLPFGDDAVTKAARSTMTLAP